MGPEGCWAGPLSNAPQLHEHAPKDCDELLILASDGQWDSINSQSVVRWAHTDLVQSGASLKDAAELLVTSQYYAASCSFALHSNKQEEWHCEH